MSSPSLCLVIHPGFLSIVLSLIARIVTQSECVFTFVIVASARSIRFDFVTVYQIGLDAIVVPNKQVQAMNQTVARLKHYKGGITDMNTIVAREYTLASGNNILNSSKFCLPHNR